MIKYAIFRHVDGDLEVKTCPVGCEKAMVKKFSDLRLEEFCGDEFLHYRDAVEAGEKRVRQLDQE
jgi:hypothetical protein